MSAWIQGHLWQITVVVVLYLLLSGLWRLSKHLWRKRRSRKEPDGRS